MPYYLNHFEYFDHDEKASKQMMNIKYYPKLRKLKAENIKEFP